MRSVRDRTIGTGSEDPRPSERPGSSGLSTLVREIARWAASHGFRTARWTSLHKNGEALVDKASGTLARRPSLDEALRMARPGDQLVITKLDRLGRSLEHRIALSRDLQARGVDLVVLDQGIDTSTAVGRMFFQILGAIAEFEHALMSERTRDGLEASRARGRTGGQKPKLTPRQAGIAQAM